MSEFVSIGDLLLWLLNCAGGRWWAAVRWLVEKSRCFFKHCFAKFVFNDATHVFLYTHRLYIWRWHFTLMFMFAQSLWLVKSPVHLIGRGSITPMWLAQSALTCSTTQLFDWMTSSGETFGYVNIRCPTKPRGWTNTLKRSRLNILMKSAPPVLFLLCMKQGTPIIFVQSACVDLSWSPASRWPRGSTGRCVHSWQSTCRQPQSPSQC